ncbi:MAG: hypothetical protein PHS64_08415 [Candidatus Omnitrophica bacterium]|nr:hypothetical protein [Candidatus Omnitrophota bacterium]MDD4941867.1 hypothetical protein [Candidatus Omnitrophota bacterium]MDD5775950.1 hypothetical protein [Candidatus Omnitrophota bacterium]HNQ50985.1 hypothetical protein [Candidatus Omnitrophota bacterium]HQO38460.1 hypothetical protein [Candidatus Omnitrophota bacterium]
MAREKVSLGFRIKHWFTYHPWLKIIALVLAVMAWFYVSQEISNFR